MSLVDVSTFIRRPSVSRSDPNDQQKTKDQTRREELNYIVPPINFLLRAPRGMELG